MTKSPTPPADSVATRLALFPPAPLLEGEDPTAYDDLLARVSAAVKPVDIFEEIWLRDIVDLTWEIFRLRRLKTDLLRANASEGLKKILESFYWDAIQANALAKLWASRDDATIKEVNELLASAGLTMDSVMAQTLSVKINDIERIDRMIMGAEGRRNVVLREVDLHRANLGDALRQATREVEDAEFHEVKATQLTDRNAA